MSGLSLSIVVRGALWQLFCGLVATPCTLPICCAIADAIAVAYTAVYTVDLRS